MDLGSVRMKLALLCLCLLQLALVSAGIFTRNDLQATYSNLSASRAQSSHSTGSLNQGRQKPLFARRGQYERQRIHVPKHRVVPVPPNDHPPPPLSPKVAPKPVNPKCSQVTQSCLPQSGCCDPNTMCHCRFFNAICFCRRANEKKT
ncbi:agouti-signaling protein [Lates calcarifer]|uniref:Agouti-signaling protein n=1 Tax=Lates calcarifer TaxID=8187 RepID=A0A4W6G3R3_LATCA|nr:agouti-signaling protein [Lates calcarifer]